jgi:hypothetical protein
MLHANAFTIRPALEADEPTLAWLAALASQPPVQRPALIGDVDGIPAAAISVADGRVVVDPFRPSTALVTHLRLHRSGWRTGDGRAAVRNQLRAALPFMI